MALPQVTQVWMTADWEFGIGSDQPKGVQVFQLEWLQPVLFGLAIALTILTTMALRYLYPRFRRFTSSAVRNSRMPWFTGPRSVASTLAKEASKVPRRFAMRLRTRFQNS